MTTTTIRPDECALAGLGLDKPLLLRVARCLLADVYWDDEREGDYVAACNLKPDEFPHIKELMDRPETPQILDEEDALIRMAGICGRIEQAWRESFYSLSRRMVKHHQVLEHLQEELVYRTIMGCIGHGITPRDMSGFPQGRAVLACPISIENPMQHQLDLLP